MNGTQMRDAGLCRNGVNGTGKLRGARLGEVARIHLRSWMVAAVTFALLSGCALTSNEIKWTEEVQLHDGRVIQVKRRTELTDSGFPTQRRGFRKFHELCYEPMGIYWKSNPEYRPHIFDIVDGKAYMKVPVGGCAECMLHGYPVWDAAYLVWESGAWRKVDETPELRALRFNLLSDPRGANPDEDARGLVELLEKRKRDGSIYYSMTNTGRTGPGTPGACNRCRGVRIQTDRTSEVLISSNSNACDW